MTRRSAGIALVAAPVALLLAVGAVVWFARGDAPTPPDPETNTPRDVLDFLKSDLFVKLSEEARYAYIRKLEEQGPEALFRHLRDRELSDEDFEKLRQNVAPIVHRRMKERVEEYCAMPVEERQKELDKIIDKMQEARKEWEARRAAEGDDPEAAAKRKARRERWRGRGMNLDRLRKRIEQTDPETRAKFVQVMIDMRLRMMQRGIEFRPPHAPRD